MSTVRCSYINAASAGLTASPPCSSRSEAWSFLLWHGPALANIAAGAAFIRSWALGKDPLAEQQLTLKPCARLMPEQSIGR